MPPTRLVFFQEADGKAPVMNWLEELRRKDRRGYAKCVVVIDRLASFGYELKRPLVDYLRNGIYELRAKHGRVNYRILYFFHGQNLVVLAHGLTKEGRVPSTDLQRAIKRKKLYEKNQKVYTYQG